MKKIVLLLLVLCVGWTVSARRIVSPQYDYRNSTDGRRCVRAVELSDSGTVFHISMSNLPGYWCCIDSIRLCGQATGRVYRPVEFDGYVLGQKQVMPESGRHDFSVRFDKIDSRDSIADLIFGADEVMRGIRLDGNEPEGKYHVKVSGAVTGGAGMVVVVEDTPYPIMMKSRLFPVDSDGRFCFDLYGDEQKVYRVMDAINFNRSAFLDCKFFMENTSLEVSVGNCGNDFITEVIAPEGTLTRQVSDYKKEMSRLFDESPVVQLRDSLELNRALYSPEYYELVDRIESMDSDSSERDSLIVCLNRLYDNGTYITPEGSVAEDAVRSFADNELRGRRIEYARKMDSLAGVYMLTFLAWFMDDTVDICDAYREAYADKYAGNPYADYLQMLAGSQDPVPGNRYIDFSAPGLDGRKYTLSELIKGRPALIDLWAPWCGPCRRASKSMIPVYEEFAPKGFTVVGVARDVDNAMSIETAVKKDGYPWLTLVELDDCNKIWGKYRRSNAAGGVFMVDADGKILAVDPSAEEVREILTRMFERD